MTREQRLENVVSVLVGMLGGHVILTNEEIEDAGDIEARDLFETDQVEFRSSGRKKPSQWVTDTKDFEQGLEMKVYLLWIDEMLQGIYETEELALKQKARQESWINPLTGKTDDEFKVTIAEYQLIEYVPDFQ